tara:strand:+ start:51076 stop:51714 length:639 start_codon:yes stop_codon:yes gene_type:complete
MGIEAIPHKGGAGRAKIVCEDCGRDEVIPCAYVGSGNAASNTQRPNESQARAKALHMKWSYIKGKLRCPSCEAKRKVGPMKAVTTATTATKAPEPSKRERIQIISMLAEVYDLDAGMYSGGDTDETVAEVLGVMPGFVAIVREAEFGPAGGNEDMTALKIELEAAIKDAEARVQEAEAKAKSALAAVAVMHGLRERLGKIETAVGKRILARA